MTGQGQVEPLLPMQRHMPDLFKIAFLCSRSTTENPAPFLGIASFAVDLLPEHPRLAHYSPPPLSPLSRNAGSEVVKLAYTKLIKAIVVHSVPRAHDYPTHQLFLPPFKRLEAHF
jgi:hypothetical protein